VLLAGAPDVTPVGVPLGALGLLAAPPAEELAGFGDEVAPPVGVPVGAPAVVPAAVPPAVGAVPAPAVPQTTLSCAAYELWKTSRTGS
jgi:hypothetical protein